MVDHTDDLSHDERSFRLRGAKRVGGPGLTWRVRRLCLAGVTFAITVAFVMVAVLGLLSLRLARGPISLPMLDGPVLNALSARMQPGFKVGVDGVDLEAVDGKPAIALKQLQVRDEAGRPIFKAPRAVVAVDPLRLLAGTVVPTRLDVRDVVLRLSILPDGSAALSAGSDDAAPLRITDAVSSMAGDAAGSQAAASQVPEAGAPATTSGQPPATRLAALLASVIDRFSGADQGLGGFARFGVSQGTLILDDRTHETVTSFGNLDLQFQKLAATSSLLTLAADGAQGRWSVRVRGTSDPTGQRSLSMNLDGVTLDDLRAIPALRDVGLDSDLVMSANLQVGLDAAGQMMVARGRVATGDGFLHLHDPDHEPLFLTGSEVAFHYDAAAGAVLVDNATIKAETASYDMNGSVVPPARDGEPWAVAMSGHGIFGAERPGEKPLVLSTIDLGAHAVPSVGRITLDALRIRGSDVDLNLTLDVQHTPQGLLVKGGASSGHMPAQAMLRIWPTTVAADVRAWLLVNLQGGAVEKGTVSFALDEDDLAKMKALRSVADTHLRVDYTVSDVTLAFMSGVPPLRRVMGHGSVTGDSSQFVVDSGVINVSTGRDLSVSNGALSVPSTDLKPSPASITAHVAGGIDALTDLLTRDALKPYADVPSDLAGARGQIAGDLSVGLKIGRGATSKDVKIGATADITDLTVEKIVGKQNLTAGQINLVLDKAGLRIKGEARVFGAGTQIDLRKPAGTGAGEANVLLTLDDAARVKAGLNLGKQLTGAVAAKVTVPIGGSDKRPVNVELDLAKAGISNLLPGLSKPAGKPGRATLSVTPTASGVTLDNIVCDIGTFAVRGAATLSQDGDFQAAKLSQIRLSPGDDMKAEVSSSGDGLKVTVHGANIDARPFLKNLTGGDAPEGGAKNLDLELHSAVLTGQNSQALTGVDLRMSKRDGQMRRLQLDSRFGRAAFTVRSSQEGRDLVLTAASGDAGATLAFLDLYKKVGGGKLDANIRMSATKFDGYATIHDFVLRDDVAMKRLTEEGIQQERKGNVQIDPSNLNFTKLYVIFAKAGSRMNIKDGGMFGPQMGATVQGWIDLGAEKLQLGGTYVPAYGLNNLFSQIPVFGPILGGGSHEGLLGINFRLSGSTDSPNLTIDPLSALAPGFLRKIFGAITDATQESAAPTIGRQQTVPDSVAQ